MKQYGCVYDGITDDSQALMQIKAEELYFPQGDIALNSEAVRWLFSHKVSGEGEIWITDFFRWNGQEPKYNQNGHILVSDFSNSYIASLNLPNEAKPATTFAHQNRNGWITNYYLADDAYRLQNLTCWGQIYPVVDCSLNAWEEVTMYIGKLDFYYYDETKKQWIEALDCDTEFPKLWGFYDAEYRAVSDGGKSFIPIDEGAIVQQQEEYLVVTFPYGKLKNRVLHFGVDSSQVPAHEPELFVKASVEIWVEAKRQSKQFVANLGFDGYMAPDSSAKKEAQEEKIRKEYCGSRFITIEDTRKTISLAYVRDRYELLR